MEGAPTLQMFIEHAQAISAQFIQRRLIDFNEQCSNTCYDICVQKPGKDLTSSEEKCLKTCHTKYISARRIVTKSVVDIMNTNHKK